MSVSNNWKWAHVHSVWVSGKWNTFAEGQWSVVRYPIWKSAVFRTNTTVISADSPPRVASTMQPKPTRAPLGPKVECLSSGPGVNMDVGLLIRTVEEPLLKPLWTTRELKVIHFHPTMYLSERVQCSWFTANRPLPKTGLLCPQTNDVLT